MIRSISVTANVNGRRYQRDVEPRLTLADFLRDRLRLTGTHLGCEHGVCGACTVLADGAAVRSCLVFAVQMQGAGSRRWRACRARRRRAQRRCKEAFSRGHGLQCGFCTPGFVVSVTAFLDAHPDPSQRSASWAVGEPLPVHGLPGHRPRGPGRTFASSRKEGRHG